MADEKKKDEAKEPKVKLAEPPEPVAEDTKEPTPEAAKAAPAQPQMRQLVIQTDGRAINIVMTQLTTLELHEVGRQLMAL